MSRLAVLFSGSKLLFAVALVGLLAFKGEKDPLHKRVFNISLMEVKDGNAVKKPIADRMYFKDGKLFTDYLYDKFGFKYIRYRINKDSVYTDSTDTQVRLLVVEASATDEDNQTVIINFEQEEWDLEGVIRVTKNDKLKKYFDIVGREKGGKPKKKKKNPDANKKKLIEVIPAGSTPTTAPEVITPPDKVN
jgi:hypothetical protein